MGMIFLCRYLMKINKLADDTEGSKKLESPRRLTQGIFLIA